MKYALLFFLLFCSHTRMLNAQTGALSSFSGKSLPASLPALSGAYSVVTFPYDESITLTYIIRTDQKVSLIDVLSFRDTIIRITTFRDQSLSRYRDKSKPDSIHTDAARIQAFETYCLKRYGITPDYGTLPAFGRQLNETFGLGCGAGGSPTRSGALYRNLRDSVPTQQQVQALLFSFHPSDRLVGILLFDPLRHAELEESYALFVQNTYTYFTCSGCLNSGKKYTAAEIRAAVKAGSL